MLCPQFIDFLMCLANLFLGFCLILEKGVKMLLCRDNGLFGLSVLSLCLQLCVLFLLELNLLVEQLQMSYVGVERTLLPIFVAFCCILGLLPGGLHSLGVFHCLLFPVKLQGLHKLSKPSLRSLNGLLSSNLTHLSQCYLMGSPTSIVDSCLKVTIPQLSPAMSIDKRFGCSHMIPNLRLRFAVCLSADTKYMIERFLGFLQGLGG
mmetsp:Transcript_43285/g.75812  ORF Transcript_43285/g.75812 Transcript_43285/m.75812 type:complete len:206 (-) Transcript_43285:494-1111(-)